MTEIRRNKLLSMFVTVILIVFLCSFCSLADEIQPKKLTNSEGFVYTLNEDGTAEITGYTGNDPAVVSSTGITPGVDNASAYPTATSLALGITLNLK